MLDGGTAIGFVFSERSGAFPGGRIAEDREGRMKEATKKPVAKAAAKEAPKKSEAVKAETAKGEATKAEAKKGASAKADSAKAEPKAETAKAPAKAAKAAAPKAAPAKRDGKKEGQSAFAKPLKPSKELSAVVGDDPLPRTEVVKKVWEYIKKNDLQNEQNKREIVADANLKAVFGRDKVTMFEMNKLLASHLS